MQRLSAQVGAVLDVCASPCFYSVQPTDTCESIGDIYGLTTPALLDLNRGLDGR